MPRFLSFGTILSALIVLSGLAASTALAQDSSFINTTPNADWFAGSNWSGGTVPNSTQAALISGNRSALLSNGTSSVEFLGLGGSLGAGQLTIDGSESVLNITDSQVLVQTGGSLIISNGGALDQSGSVFTSLTEASVLVTGTGSVWNAAATALQFETSGTGTTLTVQDGGVISSNSQVLIENGSATVDGPGSQWNTTDNFFVQPSASLTISNGGSVSDVDGNVDFFTSTSGAATVLVTGTGSTWTNSGALTIGQFSGSNDSALTIENGATVSSASTVLGGDQTIHLGTGGLAGSLITGDLNSGGTIDADFTNTGTLVADISSATIKKSGSGTLAFSGNSSFGTMEIDGGAVRLDSLNAAAGLDVTLNTANGLAFKSGVGGEFAVQSLSGTGGVVLDDNHGDGIQLDLGSDFIADNTYGGVISGDGNLNKIGASTLYLTGSNTYSNGTIISDGVLNFANASSLGTGLIRMDGGTLQWATGNTADISAQLEPIQSTAVFDTNGNNVTFASDISGFGELDQVGSGTLTLSGSNSYAFATRVLGDTIRVTTGQSLGTGEVQIGQTFSDFNLFTLETSADMTIANDIDFESGGVVSVDAGTTLTLTGNIGSQFAWGAPEKQGLGTLRFSGTDSPGRGLFIDSGTFELLSGGLISEADGSPLSINFFGGPATTVTLDGGSEMDLPYVDFNNTGGSAGGDVLNIGTGGALPIISGIFGIQSEAAGTETVNVNFVGTGTLEASLFGNIDVNLLSTGTLALDGSGEGDIGTINVNNGAIRIDTQTVVAGANVAISQGGSVTVGTGVTDLSIGALSGTGNFALVNTDGDGVNLDLGDGASNGHVSGTYGGVLSGTGTLTKDGLGTQVLTGSNTFKGNVFVETGTLGINSDAALGASTNTVDLEDSDGDFADIGILRTMANITTSRTFLIDAGSTGQGGGFSPDAGTTFTLTSNISTGVIYLNGLGTMVYSGTDSNTAGDFLEIDSGKLTVTTHGKILNADGASVGGLSDASELLIQAGGTVAAGSVTIGAVSTGTFNSDGSVVVTGTGSSLATGGQINLGSEAFDPVSGDLLHTSSGTLSVLAGAKVTGNAALLSGSIWNDGGGTIDVSGSGSGLLIGQIHMAGDGAFTVENSGTVNSVNIDTFGSENGVVVTVTGTGSMFTGHGMTIGDGGLASLTISNGGKVKVNSLDIGVSAGDVGSVVINSITGTGGIALIDTGSLSVGTGGSGTLTMQSGVAAVSSLILGGGASSSATVFMTGGTLTGTNGLTFATSSTSAFHLQGGLLQLGGPISAAANSNYIFDWNSGTIQATANFTSSVNATLAASSTNTLDLVTHNVTWSGTLGGAGALSKIGTGTLTLTGANTYSGGTVISAGLVNFANLANFGTGTISLKGGGLQWAAGNTLDISASSQFDGTLGGTTDTFDTNGNHVTLSGNLSGAAGLNKVGTGTLTLSGSNAYTGATTITAGTLEIATSNALSPSGPLTFSGGTLLADNPVSSLANAVVLTANSTITGSSALTFSNTMSLSANAILTLTNTGTTTFGAILLSNSNTTSRTLTFNTTTGDAVVTGPISNGGSAGGLTKTGAGLLTLSGSNSYIGTTALFAGTLQIANQQAVGTGTIALAGGAIQGDGVNAYTLGNALTLSASSTISGVSALTFTGTLSQTAASTLNITNTSLTTLGAINLSSGANSRTLTANVSNSAIFGGVIADGGTKASGLTKTGTGTLILSAANTYTGTTTVTAGTLQIGNNGATGSIAGLINNNATVAFNRTDSFSYSGTINGSGSVAQIGTGALTISGSNGYSGGTVVTSGTLAANNAHAVGTGTVSVQGGVYLIDAGVTVTNHVSLAGGEFDRAMSSSSDLTNAVNATSSFAGGKPDTSASILQGTLSSASTLQSSFLSTSSANNDDIRLSDVYRFQGTSTDVFVLQLSISSVSAGSMLAYLDSDGDWVNAIDGNTGGTPTFVSGAYNASLDFHLGFYGVDISTGTVWAVIDHNSDYSIVAAPEPSAWILFGGGLLLVGIIRRRRSSL